MDEAALQVNDDDTAVREPIIEVSNNRIRMVSSLEIDVMPLGSFDQFT